MQQGAKYNVDIVVCIDTTGSMQDFIGRVKSKALEFHTDLSSAMGKKQKSIDQLRVRVIAFRDYYVNNADALRQTQFYEMPANANSYADFVNSCAAGGGGDTPETSLEALASAIRSDWTSGGDKRRHVIVMWTDTTAHPLEKDLGAKPANYPQDMPKNFDELTDLWEGQSSVSQTSKRLILYAPDAEPWTTIATNWGNTVHFPSTAGGGLEEVDYNAILDAVANSV